MKQYHIYILTNWDDSVMYIGMTSNLEQRIWQHKNKTIEGFSSKYNLEKLVYFEETSDVHAAIAREKQIKSWRREKKNILVAETNPEWKDLANGTREDPSLRSG